MAVSGIGNPHSFTQTLTDVGYNVVHTLPFGDHHDFTNDDVVDIWKEAFAHQADAICITEKDAVKLSQLHAIEDLKNTDSSAIYRGLSLFLETRIHRKFRDLVYNN